MRIPARLVAFALLVSLLGLPLVLPLGELMSAGSWEAWTEAGRVGELALNTLGLCALTLLLAFPPGGGLAVLLYRTDLPGRSAWRAVLGVGLFVPLPLFALAWQATGGGGWRPWTQGLFWASFVHAAAALPWVVWLTGLGLTRVEPELEEDAWTAAPGWRVFWRVSCRRAGPAFGLAAVWVALQAAGEIAVTDMALVRTFAEEVLTQFVTGGPTALGRAVAVSLPATLLAILVVGLLLRRWEGRLAITASGRPPLVFRLGRARWPLAIVVGLAVAAYAGVPVVSLIRQAGGGNEFTVSRLGLELKRAVTLHLLMVLDRRAWLVAAGVLAAGLALVVDSRWWRGLLLALALALWVVPGAVGLQLPMVLDSLVWAVVAGVLAAGLALAASWFAADSRWWGGFLFALAVALWAVPGPVLGFGLKEAIDRLMDVEDVLLGWSDARPVRAILYELSTPLPVLWAHVARLFPYAVAFVWPAVRDVPRDLRESARVDGAGPWDEFRHVGWPAVRGAWLLAVVAVTALALGELSASKIVQVPGRQTFVQELFNQMHYGATATTAALALVQLSLALGAWAVILIAIRRTAYARAR